MRFVMAVAAFVVAIGVTPLRAQDNPVVLELFTSQGCSACPPADALLNDLALRDDVIALALHVDYWDYIGWADVFARPEFTARQKSYARAAQATTVYTPQIVIGGRDQLVGSRAMQVMDTVQTHKAAQSPFRVALARDGGTVLITAAPGPRGAYDVQMVRYIPQSSVAITRGENAGRTLTHANIVTSWVVLRQWDGAAPLALRVAAPGNDPLVVIIQQAGTGPIVAAARLR